MPDDLLSVLYDRLNVPAKPSRDPAAAGFPIPEAPPLFRPMPVTNGGPVLGDAVKQLLRYFPELQGKLPSIGFNPTGDVFEMTGNIPGLSPLDFDSTNIAGMSRVPADGYPIYIDQKSSTGRMPIRLPETLAHESAHAVGLRHPEVNAIGKLYQMLVDRESEKKREP